MTDSLGYIFKLFTQDFNQPWIEITNSSSEESILEFNLTIGDTDYNFDAVAPNAVKSPGITETLASPDFDYNGGDRSDELRYSFNGFEPGKFFQIVDVDFDIDNIDSFEDYRQILFDLNGSDSSDNGNISVTFSNGSTLTGQLPDFAQTPDDNYTFSQSLADANNIIVDTLDDENDGDLSPGNVSLREALAAIADGGTIVFSPGLTGTITLDSILGQLEVNKPVTIHGPGADVIAVSGNNQARVFNINDGDSSNHSEVVLEGLTIANGETPEDGGGIWNEEDLIIVSSNISENSAGGNGGGIYNRGKLALKNSIVSGNEALIDRGLDVGGGGIFNDGIANINDSKILDNYAYYGGGILNIISGFAGSANLTVMNSILSRNSAEEYGGGIHNGFGGTATVENTTLSYNSAVNGGGIYNKLFGDFSVTSSTISGNSASSSGGGIFSYEASLAIINSTISNNTANEFGGGISFEVFPFDVNLSSSTITENIADFDGDGLGNGGGIHFNYDDDLYSIAIHNSIIANNFDTSNNVGPGDIHPDVSGSFASEGHNLVGNASGSIGFGTNGDRVGTSASPIDPLLGPLQNNGGTTLTHKLLLGSPAIDAGDPGFTPPPEFDQRGSGFARVVNSRIDIGAFEAQSNPELFISISGAREDILQVNSDGTIESFFDGSNVGIERTTIDAFDIIDDDTILMSFRTRTTLDGLGTVEDADVVRFTAISLGTDNTTGSFEMEFDASDVGLRGQVADVDALVALDDGSLLLSFVGDGETGDGTSFKDEDLLGFNGTFGQNTSGGFSEVFDGSNVALSSRRENVSAAGVTKTGGFYLSTRDQFKVDGLKGNGNDIFEFVATSLGERNTSGTFSPTLVIDGSEVGINSNINALDTHIGTSPLSGLPA